MSSVLVDKANLPDDASLRDALGDARQQWDAIVARAHVGCAGLVAEWKHDGRKHGWQLKLSTKRHGILDLIPHRGSFTVALALNAKAVAALRANRFAEPFVRQVENARTLPDGKAARLEVADRKSAELVIKLLAVKVASII